MSNRKKILIDTSVNVILTFMEGPQVFYNAKVAIPNLYVENQDLEALEADIVESILDQRPDSEIDLGDLIKISLWYNTPTEPNDTPDEFSINMGFLCRNHAKYYFRPTERTALENRLVEDLRIAQNVTDSW